MLESFQLSGSGGSHDDTAVAVDAYARRAVAYLAQRTGIDPFAGSAAPVVIVHPDHADRANRSGLWMRGPFDAGQGILVVPDPRSSAEGEVHQISLEAVAHALVRL